MKKNLHPCCAPSSPKAHRRRTLATALGAYVLFNVLGVSSGCADDYPACTPGDEGAGAGGPGDPVVIVGAAVGAGGDYGAEEEGAHGYARNPAGEVCECDARDAERLGCVDRPPNEKVTEYCDDADRNSATGECLPGTASSEPQPQTPHLCGEVYWCCYTFEWLYGTEQMWNIPICPSLSKQPNTRHAAYHIWLAKTVTKEAAKYYKNKELPPIHRTAQNCYSEPIDNANDCGWYPSGK